MVDATRTFGRTPEANGSKSSMRFGARSGLQRDQNRRRPRRDGASSTYKISGNEDAWRVKIALLNKVDTHVALSSLLEKLGLPESEVEGVTRQIFALVAARKLEVEGRCSLPEPSSGYPMFPGRRVADAVEWYNEHWARYVPAGLDQAKLAKRDRPLLVALNNVFRGNRDGLRAILPTSSSQNSIALQSAFGTDFGGDVRARAHALQALGSAGIK